ncbi:ATPase [Lentisphaera araneosa HTCC2155]|uniref:ATPase n=1 Tax=Lentisphaera araneosa HTCC2155 TaxID=313628 RepID=A6DRI3_9BACT|nr:AAA family ATPase [Lentisphaera araneosa]EDM25793.1 ATPase [Lentisphaera araneosa HTCC2155]
MEIKELKQLSSAQVDAGALFSGKKSSKLITAYHKPNSYTPDLDPHYIFHESSRDIIVWFMHKSDPLYLFGPTGSGKTSLVKQVAAKLNYPVFEITGHSRLEYPDMIGHLSVEKGNMQYRYGPLALAMKYGGVFLLNEIDLLDPSTAAGLNTMLDGAPLCIPENDGELIKPHPNFRFIATANTNGASDEHGLYQGALRQNLAFMDRFWLSEVPYPEKKTEELLLEKAYPDLPQAIRTKMVELASEVRQLFIGAQQGMDRIEVTFSTRTLLRWADLTLRFQPLAAQGIQPINYALDRSLGFRASTASRAVLHELSQRIFPVSKPSKEK